VDSRLHCKSGFADAAIPKQRLVIDKPKGTLLSGGEQVDFSSKGLPYSIPVASDLIIWLVGSLQKEAECISPQDSWKPGVGLL
jgi:hypothetical protein